MGRIGETKEEIPGLISREGVGSIGKGEQEGTDRTGRNQAQGSLLSTRPL